ncbi:MAG TPA: DUF3443 domain-containing protein [Vicinamibacterales bacterium]|nr:DUF3443 domain-containing protein [Vicinamibacterales bacterium]
MTPRLLLFAALLVAQVSPQCGSSGSTSGASATQNTLSVVVNAGPHGDYFNGLFTSVVVCVPGTSTCQTIGGILVDSGSEGLRILNSALTLSLPQRTASSGAPLVECAQFEDGFTWGPVQTADVKMAGETASAIPIQVIGESQFPSIPQACTSTGVSEDTLADLGANGILGIGNFREDCGSSCAAVGSSNPAFYFGCPSSGCTVASVANTQQLQNPVWLFSSDNNGVVIQLPSVAAGGAATVSGTLLFGIGTQSNNALGSAKVQTTDGAGNFTTIYNNQSYTQSFIDSGSNGLFFLDTATTGLPVCPDAADFYCPARTQTLTATTRGGNGVTATVTFNIGNADQLDGRFTAFAELGGPNPGSFDWGLPFFFGRNVFIAIDGQSAPGGTAPYWAY